jgi:hypothetical protein
VLHTGPVGQQVSIICNPWLCEKKIQKRFAEEQTLTGDETKRLGHFQEQNRRLFQSPVADMLGYLLDKSLTWFLV